jgi:magnesium chelatase subunit D
MTAWGDAAQALDLLAADPHGLQGMIVRARPGPVRDALLARLAAGGRAVVRVPANVDAGRLLGGLDLERTLATGAPVLERGLLEMADGGLLLCPMAERMAPETATALAAMLDTGRVRLERDGLSADVPARAGLILLDEGDDGETVPAILAERMAFVVDLDGVAWRECAEPVTALPPAGDAIEEEAAARALCGAAIELGISGLRPPLLGLRAARAMGGGSLTRAGLEAALRLVLLPRATRLPAPADAPPPPPPPSPPDAGEAQDSGSSDAPLPADLLLEAALASLPPGVLAAMVARQTRTTGRATGAGAKRRGATRGRPVGAIAGSPGRGARLALPATLRAAAPWQRLRERADGRVAIRKADLRIRRFEEAAETTTIFAVDASGSAAAERLAEAKGAVELLLAEAYVRRTDVALIAFRGERADLLLPPTRSLTRAKRALAGLPGGGGTPLAAGLAAALGLARDARGRGRTPFLVLMTDGRANVALDGSGGRERAMADAATLARAVQADGISATLIDISARPRPEARDLAAQMGARLIVLPRARPEALKAAIDGVAA